MRAVARLAYVVACAALLIVIGASDAHALAIGNRVWFDTNDNGVLDGGEAGIDGVSVTLYSTSNLTTPFAATTTAGGGYYIFTGLAAGDYVVSVDASNFGGVLSGYWSSGTSRTNGGAVTETAAPLANNDTDLDDNGTLQTAGALNGSVISSTVTLIAGTEPIGETDLGTPAVVDADENMTVDFGFYTMTLGNQVWNDSDNSGTINGGEAGIDGVAVEIRSGDGATLLGSTTTAGGGFYTFTGLPAGDYIVRLPAINFNPGGVLRDFRSSTGPLPAVAFEPAPDPDTNTTDSDDNGTEANGLLGLGGFIQTTPVTLTPGAEASSSNATGTTTESRVDFGVNNNPQLDLRTTNTDNQTTYQGGATLTYTVVVTNDGPADATGMTVSATRPAQIASWTWTCASAAFACTSSAGNPATFTDSLDLPQLNSVTYTVTAQVVASPTGNLTLQAVASPPVGLSDASPQDNTGTDTDTLIPAVPTTTEWQLLVLAAVLVVAGGWLLRRA